MFRFALLLAAALVAPASLATPAEDLAAFRAFYQARFPDIGLDAHKDGAYALDEEKRDQWLEMEEFPPYEITVDEGAELYDTPLASGATYGECLGDGAPAIKQFYPKFDTASGRVITLEQAVNQCRRDNGEEALDYVGQEMAALTAYIAYASRGNRIAVEIPDDKRALAAYEEGKRFYYERRGQLNFACSSCHQQMVGNMLRAERLSASVGHATHWPVYRFKWEQVGPLHKRFKECNSQVKAEPFAIQSEAYTNLEYFLTYMNNGMELNGPASRK